jgi:hypothetical protein
VEVGTVMFAMADQTSCPRKRRAAGVGAAANRQYLDQLNFNSGIRVLDGELAPGVGDVA